MLYTLPASAQEGEEARYQVQPGDSLSAIAARFGISVESLVQANDLVDPDQLDAGMELVLPGLDWIDGLIVDVEMPFGEDLSSLSRKYGMDEEALSRLNRISSPQQLFIGRSILLATGRGEQLSSARTVMTSGQSLMEMALLARRNPWEAALQNRLTGTSNALPGDVLLIPGAEQEGAGRLPSPLGAVKIGTGGIMQGKATAITLGTANQDISASISILDTDFQFLPHGDDALAAITGVHVMAEPGLYDVELRVVLTDGSIYRFEQLARVRSGGYGFETVTVDPELLDEETSEKETAQIAEIVSGFTPEKMWTGFFLSPSPFENNINSAFGTRRSFNGSGFEYFHAGVDFGGGLGVQIFAPAAGRVVFAGSLEIRGNATIIDHGWGVYSGYFHQSEMQVEVGDIVETGQVIGIVGNTGRSSGAHLHWEMWVGGIQVDALEWLSRLFP